MLEARHYKARLG